MNDYNEAFRALDEFWETALLEHLNVPAEEVEKIKRAGLLSDVGKATAELYRMATEGDGSPESDRAIAQAAYKVVELRLMAGIRSSPQQPGQP